MKASIGRIVVVRMPSLSSNGTNVFPAMITRSWFNHDTIECGGAVNLIVFPDQGIPVSLSSVMLYDTEEEATAKQQGNCAWWPARA